MVECDAVGLQVVDQRQHTLQGIEERPQLGQLGPDVAVDAGDLDMRQFGGTAIQRRRLVDGDTELVLLEAGGDIGMGLRVDIRVDPQRDRRADPEFAGEPGSGAPARPPIRR